MFLSLIHKVRSAALFVFALLILPTLPAQAQIIIGGCSYSISPSSINAPATGSGTSSYMVSVYFNSSSCSFDISVGASWIGFRTFVYGNSTNATVPVTVDPNTSTSSRTGTLTIGGRTLTVYQSGTPAPTPAPQPLPAIALGRATANTVTATISPPANLVGTPVNIWMGAIYGAAMYLRNGANWGGYVSGPYPVAISNVVLAAGTNTVTVENGVDISGLVGLKVYVGYGTSQSDMLNTPGRLAMIYTVPTPTNGGSPNNAVITNAASCQSRVSCVTLSSVRWPAEMPGVVELGLTNDCPVAVSLEAKNAGCSLGAVNSSCPDFSTAYLKAGASTGIHFGVFTNGGPWQVELTTCYDSADPSMTSGSAR